MKTVSFDEVDWNVVEYCPTCGYFYNPIKDEHFDVSYSSMPAEMAIQLMTMRQGVLYRHPNMKGNRKRKAKGQKKGFGKS